MKGLVFTPCVFYKHTETS